MNRRSVTLLQLRTALRVYTANLAHLADSRQSMLKVMSVLVAAVWTLSMYFSHEREQQKLAVEHQKLSNQMLASALRQAAATSTSEVVRAELSAESLRLETQLKEVALRETRVGRLKLSHDIDVSLSDRLVHLYDGAFQLRVDNISKAPIEVSWVVFETYLGKLRSSLSENSMMQINAPPRRELGEDDNGIIIWTLQAKRGFYLADSKQLSDDKYFLSRPYFTKGGGMTKYVESGDHAEYHMPFLVRASEDSWVAVVAILGIDGALRGPNVHVASDWMDLRPADALTAATP